MKTRKFDPMVSSTSRLRMAHQDGLWGIATRCMIILVAIAIFAIGTYGVFR